MPEGVRVVTGLRIRKSATQQTWKSAELGKVLVPPVSQPAVSPTSKSAWCGVPEGVQVATGLRIRKSSIQQTGKSAELWTASGAAPAPILRTGAEACAHGIVSNITGNARFLCLVANPMVIRFGLPKRSRTQSEHFFCPGRSELFPRFQDVAQEVIGHGPDECVNMIGHHDPFVQEIPALMKVPQGIRDEIRKGRQAQVAGARTTVKVAFNFALEVAYDIRLSVFKGFAALGRVCQTAKPLGFFVFKIQQDLFRQRIGQAKSNKIGGSLAFDMRQVAARVDSRPQRGQGFILHATGPELSESSFQSRIWLLCRAWRHGTKIIHDPLSGNPRSARIVNVPPVSEPAVSPTSKSAWCGMPEGVRVATELRIRKSAIQQTWKSAARFCQVGSGLLVVLGALLAAGIVRGQTNAPTVSYFRAYVNDIPDEPLVTVSVSGASNVTCFSVEEDVPPPATVLDISSGGMYQPAQNCIRWGPFFNTPGTNVSYRLTGLPALYPVNGGAWVDGRWNFSPGVTMVPVLAANNVTIPTPPVSVEPVVFTVTAPGTVPVVNGSFENPGLGASASAYFGALNTAQQVQLGWNGSGNSTNGPELFSDGGVPGYAAVPNGTQAVSLQGNASMSQTINFPAGVTNALSCSISPAAVRQYPLTTAPVPFHK